MAQLNSANQLIDTVGQWFAKLPPLPVKWREVIVSITPWVALIFGVLGVALSLLGLGVLTFLSPLVLLGGGLGAATSGPIAAVLWLVSSVLLLLAFKGTKERKASGWSFLFLSEAVSLVSAVALFSVGGFVGSLVGFYILFQIKSYYK